MKNRISKFAFVMLAATAGLVFASCNKQPAKAKDVTYKFFSMTIPPTTYNIGDEYYGVILSEDYETLVLKANGSFEDTQRVAGVSTESYDFYTGTWTHTGANYMLHYETLNGSPLETPEDTPYTIQNGVATTSDDEFGFVTVLHKA